MNHLPVLNFCIFDLQPVLTRQCCYLLVLKIELVKMYMVLGGN